MSVVLWSLAPPALWATYAWGAYLFPSGLIWRGRQAGRLAALTFDDGPDPVHTPKVLDVLAQERVPATFFLIGRRAAAEPGIVRRIADSGHDLGNHTWSHPSLWLCAPRRTEGEIVWGHQAIADAAGREPRFFRAPWGMVNLAVFSVLRRLRTPCVLWTVQTEGRGPADPDVQLRRGTKRARPGAIYDLHDADGVPGAGGRLVRMLPDLIRALRARGYTLAPLRELL